MPAEWNTPSTMFALFTIFSGIMLWMMSRLEGRIDSQVARIDQTISMIMEIQKEIKELYKNPPKA